MKNNLYALVQLIRVLIHLSMGSSLVLLYHFTHGKHWYNKPGGLAMKRWWMQKMARLAGVKIAQYGQPPASRCMYVANHISFLDIVVISSITDVRFLSKSSVKNWPLIGLMASVSGTLFIRRGKKKLLARIVSTVGEALQDSSIVIFPEGTTSLGNEVKRFHSGLFQAAIDNQILVQPVGLRYLKDNQLDRVAAYIEKDNFLVTLWQLLKRRETQVHVTFSGPVVADSDRQTLADTCQTSIDNSLHDTLLVSVH